MSAVVRTVGVVLVVAAISLLRRERENAEDDDRPMRRDRIAVWVAVLVVGAVVEVWAIFAN